MIVFVQGNRCGCEGQHFFGDLACSCFDSPPTPNSEKIYDVITWSQDCSSSSAGGGGGSGGGSGDEVLTVPFDKDEDVNLLKPPCEVLKEMMDPLKYNAQVYINTLKSMLPNANVEYSFSIKRVLDPSTGSYSYPPQQLTTGTQTSVNISSGFGFYGGIHLHTKDLYQTFSFGDIVNLLDNTNASYNPANGIINDNEAVLMLVSVNPQDANNPSVKSLTVNDRSALYNKVNQMLDNSNFAKQNLTREEKIEKLSRILYLKYGHDHAKFLETFKDFGISMYDYYQPNATSPGTWRKATIAQLNNQPSVLYLPDGYCN